MSNNFLVSFLMPAKNAADYLSEAIAGVQSQKIGNWELIIVDDHSIDNTYNIALKASTDDSRIKVYKNSNSGQAAALNKGFSKSTGDFIKFVDADDILHEDYILQCKSKEHDVFYHDSIITNKNLTSKELNIFNTDFIDHNFLYCLKNLMSPTRTLGTISRKTANLVFPIIEDFDCADYWISLMVKKHAKKIIHVQRPLYFYRQHSSQTYGGIYNYSSSKVFFRAKRKLNFACSVEENWHLTGLSKHEVVSMLKPIKIYLSLLGKENLKTAEIVKSKLSINQKLKLFFMRKTPRVLSILKLAKNKVARLTHFRKHIPVVLIIIASVINF